MLCLLTARLCFALESPSECSDEPKYIVLDYDDLSAYSITHGICKDGATCKCLPGDSHSITKAYIYDGNGMEYDLSVSDDQHHFDISFDVYINRICEYGCILLESLCIPNSPILYFVK